jgi:diguanylate cyclase (GGDEF)-like protein
MLALYQDWAPFLAALLYVVVHHGVTGALDPSSVYNHPDAVAHPWRWALIHGVFVVGASAASLVSRRGNEELLHEPLTGLPGRAVFMHGVARALARRRRDASLVAVLFLDLNDFKRINDSLGHAAGDRLLKAVAQRLRGCLRPTDTLARFGGDEFVVLLEGMEAPEGAAHVAERITEELGRPFILMGQEVVASASIGISVSKTGRERPEEMLRSADTAMYEVKASRLGKLGYRIFDPQMHARVMEQLRTEDELRRAIDRDELRVWYQPKVDLSSGAIVKVEALLRWEHPKRGLLVPSEFLAVAEQTGLIVPIGGWVLSQACDQLKKWQEENPALLGALGVEVNLSPVQLHYPEHLLKAVESTMKDCGLEGYWLSLDLTETTWLDAAKEKSDCLRALRNLGVNIAVDDFGTGYSSLAYLKRLPANTLKIDQSFVGGICENPKDAALVQTVVDLAHSLEMRVVAEGVEKAEQVQRLRETGCDVGQGYYFCEPLPPEEISGLLVNKLLA